MAWEKDSAARPGRPGAPKSEAWPLRAQAETCRTVPVMDMTTPPPHLKTSAERIAWWSQRPEELLDALAATARPADEHVPRTWARAEVLVHRHTACRST